MRSPRLLPFSGSLFLLLSTAGLMALTAHCAGGDDGNQDQPITETGGETEIDGSPGETSTEAGDSATDTPTDTPPVTVTCTKPPVFHPPVRLNHNPDSLRRVASAGMVLLDDGRIMAAMLEDTGSRYSVFARIVDPTTSKASDDERLDADTDTALGGTSSFAIFSIPGGAVGVAYGSHLKVFSKGKWSPDLAATMAINPFAGGELGYQAAPSGQVLVTRKGSAAPFVQGVVFRPDEGGAKGTWGTPTTLDLDGATSAASRVDRALLPDGRFMTLIWQGGGGPAIRIRALSGSWSTPSAKAEIGANNVSYSLLDDGSIVLVALESAGTDTMRATTSTWTAADGWSTSRLLSKPTADSNGVMPNTSSPYLFPVSGTEVEYVAWIAACASVAKDCEFHPISRRYAGGTWKDPVDLAIGESGRKGADDAFVSMLEDGHPVISRANSTRTQIEFRARIDATTFKPAVVLGKDSPYFGDTTKISANFYGGWQGVWTLTSRQNVPTSGAPTALPTALGKIDFGASSVTWGLVTAGAFELRSLAVTPYALGSGGFALGAGSATDGTGFAPIVAYAPAAGGSPEAASVQQSDESNASFVGYPLTPPRFNRDRSAIFVVAGKPSDTSVPGQNLRAYAWNGVGSTVPSFIANQTRMPRPFNVLTYGCGGAILYAVDPVDGSHALEIRFVDETPAS